MFLKSFFKQNKHIEAKRIVPIYFLLLYPILVALDLTTTYLGTPDLRYEANPLILKFKLNWLQIITLSTIFVVFMSIVVCKSDKLLKEHFIRKNKTKRIKIYLVILVNILFLTHFFLSFIIVPNNLLSYVYLAEVKNNFVASISKYYIENIQYLVFVKNYYLLILIVCVCTTAYFILRLRSLQTNSKKQPC